MTAMINHVLLVYIKNYYVYILTNIIMLASVKYMVTQLMWTSVLKNINPLTPVPAVTARDEPWPFFLF